MNWIGKLIKISCVGAEIGMNLDKILVFLDKETETVAIKIIFCAKVCCNTTVKPDLE